MVKTVAKQNLILCYDKRNKISFAEHLYIFASVMSLVWQYFTIVYYSILRSSIGTYITIVDLLVWAVAWLLIAVEKGDLQRQLKVVIPTVILLIFLLIKLLVSGNFSNDYTAPIRAVYQIYSFLYAIMWGLSFRLLSSVVRKKIIIGFCMALAITVIPSFFYVFQFKDAIRDESPYYGIIDFQYIYSVIPFIGMAIVALICCDLDKRLRILLFFMLATNISIILLSNFATAIMFIVFTVGLSVLIAKKINLKKLLIVCIVLLAMVLLFRNAIANIFFSLEKSDMFSLVMQHRLHDIGRILAEGEIGWSFIARFELMRWSWNTFLKNPIFGIAFDYGDSPVLGFHDTWFTLLGYGGIFAFVLIIITLISYLRLITKTMKNKFCATAYLKMLIIVLLLSFFNPVLTKSISLIALGIMPAFDSLFNKHNHKNKRRKVVKC